MGDDLGNDFAYDMKGYEPDLTEDGDGVDYDSDSAGLDAVFNDGNDNDNDNDSKKRKGEDYGRLNLKENDSSITDTAATSSSTNTSKKQKQQQNQQPKSNKSLLLTTSKTLPTLPLSTQVAFFNSCYIDTLLNKGEKDSGVDSGLSHEVVGFNKDVFISNPFTSKLPAYPASGFGKKQRKEESEFYKFTQKILDDNLVSFLKVTTFNPKKGGMRKLKKNNITKQKNVDTAEDDATDGSGGGDKPVKPPHIPRKPLPPQIGNASPLVLIISSNFKRSCSILKLLSPLKVRVGKLFARNINVSEQVGWLGEGGYPICVGSAGRCVQLCQVGVDSRSLTADADSDLKDVMTNRALNLTNTELIILDTCLDEKGFNVLTLEDSKKELMRFFNINFEAFQGVGEGKCQVCLY